MADGVLPAALTVAFLLLLGTIGAAHGQLQMGFYSDSCPGAEDMVTAAVQEAAASDATILPALVRLQFHDCFVRGCDASVLITSAGNAAEVNNNKHQGLRGLDVVDRAKAELEEQCPGVVSCADIIALAARDAIAMTNGPSFEVPTGRRDGLSSNVRDADVLPDVSDSIQVLRSKFAASGLNDRDLVLLTAAHTIGTTACFFVKDRLYSYPLPGSRTGSDPSIPAAFLSELKARCAPGDFNTRVPLVEASNATGALVGAYLGAASSSFAQDFVGAMIKMGTIGAITGDAGEIRDVCSAFNTN
ncbi:unnamed protein product [Triticum turgidum subsp. durum]|uniref:Peroxidase n=1 Tax=Triticum turgidum subsp. durum TaxID=4567 RepID=A0A9R1PT77_TRITD|nr:unnamed protein product [Triticum turgidum subsp. durum]